MADERYGYVKISRKVYDSPDPFWAEKRAFSRWEAWEDLIQSAAWAKHRRVVAGEMIELARGEVFGSLRFFGLRWGWTKNRVRTFLALLSEMVRLRTSHEHTGGTAYLVVNYEQYQGNGDSNGPANGTGVETTTGQPRDSDGTNIKQLSKESGEVTTTSVVVSTNGHHRKTPALPRRYEEVTNRIAAVMADVAANGRKSMTADETREMQADMVFAYWAAKLNHEGALLDDQRMRKLVDRLKENRGNVHELLFVVDGAKRSKHLQGQNETNTVYDGIKTIFRDREQVEKLSALGGYKSGMEHPLAQKYQALVELPLIP